MENCVKSTVLGIRLNNPFCIRYNKSNRWKGSVGKENGFVIFDSLQNGVRAGVFILLRYIFHYKLSTVREIIQRFAPTSDGNNVDMYCKSIYFYMRGVKLDDPLDFVERFTLLAQSIALVECSPRSYYYFKERGFAKMVKNACDEYMKNVLLPLYGTSNWVDIHKIAHNNSK